MMPLCGTFHYAGVVPYSKADNKSRPWKLQDQSGAAPLETGNGLVDNRLIGLQPVLEISENHLLSRTVRSEAIETTSLCNALFVDVSRTWRVDPNRDAVACGWFAIWKHSIYSLRFAVRSRQGFA